jgi:hypothetical protein
MSRVGCAASAHQRPRIIVSSAQSFLQVYVDELLAHEGVGHHDGELLVVAAQVKFESKR